ncbi:MAG: dTMP kinase [Gemmatimonadales bacterium]
MSGRIITLVGADGAGKSTHARRLAASVGPATYIYMGSNPSAATHSLPTTRLWTWAKRALGGRVDHSGPPTPGPARAPRSRAVRALRHVKSLGVVLLRASEELYRLRLASRLASRGHLVILDRHPYLDYHQRRVRTDGGWMRWGDRLHALLLRHVYPKPAQLVLLDAPAEVLYARKPEGTLEALRARRQEYLDLVDRLPKEVRVSVLDAGASQEVVAEELLALAQSRPLAEGAGRR